MPRKYGGGMDYDDYDDGYDDYDYDEDDNYMDEDDAYLVRRETKPAPGLGGAGKGGKGKKKGGEGNGGAKKFPAAPGQEATARAPPGFGGPSPDDSVMKSRSGDSNFQLKAKEKPPTPASTSEDTVTKRMSKLQVESRPREVADYVPDAEALAACDAAAGPGSRSLLNLIVLGHVDSGKSSLTGRLLYDCGLISEKRLQQAGHDASKAGHGDANWAFLLDERSEEREHGVTVDVAHRSFRTPKTDVNLLDAPGHRDFVPNMISGATQADAALLVVDGAKGGFESGFIKGGQTREHIQLARCLGLTQLIVVISKMDLCGYREDRIEEIRAKLEPYLDGRGFRKENIRWIPVSAVSGENISKLPTDSRMSWWHGLNLVDSIDTLVVPERPTARPLRLPVGDVLPKSRTLGSLVLSGRVEAGVLTPGKKVVIEPGKLSATIKGIEIDGEGVKAAVAGTLVDIGLTAQFESSAMHRGAVLCDSEYVVPLASKVEMRIAVLDVDIPILSGHAITFHCHLRNEPAHISKMKALIDSKTGEVIKKRPRILLKHQTALLEVTLGRNIPLEKYSDFKSLGRAALRCKGTTLAVGIITELCNT